MRGEAITSLSCTTGDPRFVVNGSRTAATAYELDAPGANDVLDPDVAAVVELAEADRADDEDPEQPAATTTTATSTLDTPTPRRRLLRALSRIAPVSGAER